MVVAPPVVTPPLVTPPVVGGNPPPVTPPVVVVDTPPPVTPPVVVVDTPPPVTPPVVVVDTPPPVTPPVVTPPVVAPPVVAPPAASMTVVASNVDAPTSAVVTGTDIADQIYGGRGNDTIHGGAGNDVITGDGPGTISAALHVDVSLANVADPTAYVVTISNVPAGATLSAGVNDGHGTWTLTGDQLAGLSISSSDLGGFTLAVKATATDGSGATAQSAITVSLDGGGDPGNNDVIYGGAGNDTIDGGLGNDTLFDGDGNDLVTGAEGDDHFMAGAGNDTYVGGDGFDTIDFSVAAGFGVGGVYVSLADGIASDMGNGTGEDVVYAEGVVGSVGGDFIFGSAVANTIDGGLGDDLIIGGAGADTLTGGLGSDTFIIQAEDFAISATVDTITDLQVGDIVMLGGMTQVSLVDNGNSSTLYADVNGQTHAIVELQGITGMTLDDLYQQGLLA